MDRISEIAKRMKRKTRGNSSHEESLEVAFRSFDTDNDGVLSYEEFYAGLCNFIGLVHEADAMLLFRALDIRDSDQLSIDQFRDGVYRPSAYRARYVLHGG